jgi:PAS domain S-box-containing protein
VSPPFATLAAQLNRLSARTAVVVGGTLLLLAGVVDWFSGPELAFSVFYLPSILLVAWTLGHWWGLAGASASAAVWLSIELMANAPYSHSFVPFWNGVVRWLIFSLVAVLTAEVAERKRVETALHRQTNILRSILNSMGDGVVVADREGRVTLTNPAADQMLRLAGGEAAPGWLSSPVTYLTDPLTQAPSLEHPLARAGRGETVDQAEVVLRPPAFPTERRLSVSGRPLVDPAGRRNGGVLVLTDITARRSLERQIAEISDREQRRLGQDLHDGLCQELVSGALAARVLADRLRDRAQAEADEAAGLAELLDDAITQARDVARGLCGVQLEAGGLSTALDELARRVRSRHRIPCQFLDQTGAAIRGFEGITEVHRIAQEAVNNAVKHAHARHITLTLTAANDQMELRVVDDGVGFPPRLEVGKGLGLPIMHYRARMLGAELRVSAAATGGTEVVCALKLPGLTSGIAHERF